MTALGVNMSDTDTTHDWTGLTSGHQRPAKVQAAYDQMIEAWATFTAIADKWEHGDLHDYNVIVNSNEVALAADAEYHRLCRVRQTSLEPCECRPIDADRDYTCAACRAKAELSNDGEMPF